MQSHSLATIGTVQKKVDGPGEGICHHHAGRLRWQELRQLCPRQLATTNNRPVRPGVISPKFSGVRSRIFSKIKEEILIKKTRYSDAQIMAIFKQAETGVPVAELCREHGMSSASFYKWRSKYGGMDASLMVRLKELDEENKRLKRMYAEKSMQNDLLKEALGKKW